MWITLKDEVEDTYTNVSGSKLRLLILDILSKGENIEVSFKGATPLSSSFYNSSFGEIIEEKGLPFFKERIKLKELNKSQFELMTRYMSTSHRYSTI